MENITNEQTIEILGLASVPNACFSQLLIDQLKEGLCKGSVNAGAVANTIKAIQNNSLKKVRQFRGEVLKGFHYAHWIEARNIAKNISNHWEMNSPQSTKLEDQIAKSLKEVGLKEGEQLTEKAVRQLAHDVVHQGYFERRRKGQETGEWIIFAKDNDKNIFLSLARHKEDDLDIYSRMEKNCVEYPQLFQKRGPQV